MSQNIVSFIIDLKDQWSGPMANVSKSTIGAGYTVDQLVDANKKLKEAAGKSAGSITDLRAKINALKQTKELIPVSATKQARELDKEINKLQKTLDKAEGKSNQGVFSNLFKGVPKILPIAAAGLGITEMIKGAMANGKVKEQFKNDFGQNAGAGLFEGLKKLKGVLGDGVMDMGKQLALAGEPILKVEEKIRRLGDVANGDEGKLQALTGAFAQLRKDGRLTESSMSQLESGGFKPLVLISQQTGMSLARVRERFAAGKISAHQIEEALRKATDAGGQFHGNLDRLNNTPQAGWDRMITKVTEFGEEIGTKLLPVVEPVFDIIGSILEGLIGGISEVVNWLQPLFTWVKNNADILMVFGGAILGAVGAIKAISFAKSAWATITSIVEGAQLALNVALTANPIGIVIALIAGLVAGLVVAWKKFEGFRKVVYGVWETVKSVFTSIGNLFKQIFSPIGEAIEAIKEGRWMDAAKAAGKLLFNISPIGIVKNVVEFSKGGGFSDVGNAYERGAQKGAESWAEDQRDKEASDPNSASIKAVTGIMTKEDKKKEDYNRKQDANNVSAGVNAVSGGGTQNINVTIQRLATDWVIHANEGAKKVAEEFRNVVGEEVVRIFASLSAR